RCLAAYKRNGLIARIVKPYRYFVIAADAFRKDDIERIRPCLRHEAYKHGYGSASITNVVRKAPIIARSADSAIALRVIEWDFKSRARDRGAPAAGSFRPNYNWTVRRT